MSWTKKRVIEGALEEIGLASYVFDAQAEELEGHLMKLDTMMAQWNIDGIRIGYPLSSETQTSLSQDSSIPDWALDPVVTNLAKRIAPSYGKQVSRETKTSAKAGYDTLLARSLALYPQERQFPGSLPVGAGNRKYRYRNENFMPKPSDPVDVGPDSILDLN